MERSAQKGYISRLRPACAGGYPLGITTVLAVVCPRVLLLLVLAALGSGCAAHPVEGASWPAKQSVFDLPLAWNDEQGHRVTFGAWRGQPLVLTMFFRSCQRFCPLTLSAMSNIASRLEARHIRANFVLVTLDPTRDTSPRLAEFKASRALPAASWHFLRGERGETLELARLLGIHAVFQEEHIEHNVKLLVFDARGTRVHEYVGWHVDADPLE
jgi:protein SCO1/2